MLQKLHPHRLKHTSHVVDTSTTEGNGKSILQLTEDFDKWLYGFGDTEKSVCETMEAIIPTLIPHDNRSTPLHHRLAHGRTY